MACCIVMDGLGGLTPRLLGNFLGLLRRVVEVQEHDLKELVT